MSKITDRIKRRQQKAAINRAIEEKEQLEKKIKYVNAYFEIASIVQQKKKRWLGLF